MSSVPDQCVACKVNAVGKVMAKFQYKAMEVDFLFIRCIEAEVVVQFAMACAGKYSQGHKCRVPGSGLENRMKNLRIVLASFVGWRFNV